MKKTILLFVVILTTGIYFVLNAQSNLEYFQTDAQETSRIRPNLFYELPGKINGYSMVDFYTDGTSYFGETFLTRDVVGIVGLELHAYYSSLFTDYAGIGPIVNVPIGDSTTIFTLSFLPLFVDFDGKYVKEYMLAEIVFITEFNLPIIGNLRINSFGQINLAANGGPFWQYGEAYLEKPIWKIHIGIGADLLANDKVYPDPNWGIKVGYNF